MSFQRKLLQLAARGEGDALASAAVVFIEAVSSRIRTPEQELRHVVVIIMESVSHGRLVLTPQVIVSSIHNF